MLVGFSTFHSFFLCVFCRYLTWLLCMVLVNCGVFVSKYLVSRLLSTRLSVSMLGKIPHQKQKYWWNGLINIRVQTLALDSIVTRSCSTWYQFFGAFTSVQTQTAFPKHYLESPCFAQWDQISCLHLSVAASNFVMSR